MDADAARPRRSRILPHAFPLLAALVTVSALVAANPHEGIRLVNLAIPSSVALLAALVGWGVGGLCVRDSARQGLIAMIVSLPFLTSGYLFGWVRDRADSPAAGDPWELGLVLAVVVVGIVIVRQIPRPERGLVKFLNLTTLLMLLLAAPALWRVAAAENQMLLTSASTATVPEGPRPDVYVVVLDAYSGLESLDSIYGFDNRPFLDSLGVRGFRFPDQPRANYTKTFLSVGSMLNRDYVDDLVAASAPGYRNRQPAYRALEFNRTAMELTASGYDFYYVGSSYPPMAANRLSASGTTNSVSREFEAMWIRMTAIVPVIRLKCRLTGCARDSSPFEAEDARDTEARLATLTSSASHPGPKFVLAHLLLPHGPYRFGPGCEHRPPAWTVGAAAVSDSVARRLYVEQVQCTNQKLLSLVDEIQEASADSAVIILQADHGHGRFPGDMPRDLRDTSTDQVKERFDVFAAYAGAGGIADSLAAQRTPVNVLRALFRVQWGFDEPPLEDRFYWSNTDRPLDLIPVVIE